MPLDSDSVFVCLSVVVVLLVIGRTIHCSRAADNRRWRPSPFDVDGIEPTAARQDNMMQTQVGA